MKYFFLGMGLGACIFVLFYEIAVLGKILDVLYVIAGG